MPKRMIKNSLEHSSNKYFPRLLMPENVLFVNLFISKSTGTAHLKEGCLTLMDKIYITKDEALDHVWGYGVGIDLTRRDIQNKAKESGRPWDMGKGFDNSAPCTALKPAAETGHPDTGNGAIWIKVNGIIKQKSTLNLHIWNTAETINYLSGLCELKPGDLIYMGTPDGVNAVVSGDLMEGHIDGLGDLKIKIA